MLEIGKREYSAIRHLCKSENILIPSYGKLSNFRSKVVLSEQITFIRNESDMIIGVSISYEKILHQTISRIHSSHALTSSQFPLTVQLVDGLDGSDCHQIYSQFLATNGKLCTKIFILFAFWFTSIFDCTQNILFSNNIPNSTFRIRPITLIALKENHENINHLMVNIKNSQVSIIKRGLAFPNGNGNVSIARSMLDGKMSAILGGAGVAICQLCTASFLELMDLELVRCGFSINRTILRAEELFNSVDVD